MKTRNNVQKAATKTLAVIISLVLISFTVKAQDFWKNVLSNNSFNQIAMVMVDNTSSVNESASSTYADMFAEYLAEETDEELGVEDWMVNENNFYRNVNIENESEGSLELEDWMMNESLFNRATEALQAEPENSMELENWMTSDKAFGVRYMVIIEEKEGALELEPWMVDNNVWNF